MKFFQLEYGGSPPSKVRYPIIALIKDGWNDYGYYTLYNMVIFKSTQDETEVGHIKILERGTHHTSLPNEFTQLDNAFCSLGQSLEFYEILKKHLPSEFETVLNSLNDIAINNDIDESFKEEEGYSSSLFRFSAAQAAYNDAKLFLFENKKRVNENLYFDFHIKLEGATSEHHVEFNFINTKFLPHRINVIIGKNGTGKTQFLVSLINALSGLKYSDNFNPANPLFNKVISISYSLFDNFPKPPDTTVFNYKYIGLRNKEEETVSDENLEKKLKSALRIIIDDTEKITLWFDVINSIIPLDNLGIKNVNEINSYYIDNISYKETKRLSSGQSITLFILTELIAHITEGSLVLFDEPETHLHPSAVSQLTNKLYEILEKFQSYAIVSTHSPIIIQDIPSKYISIFDRQGDTPIIRKLPIESFGENISTLTSKVFNTIDVKELYKIYLQKIADDYWAFDDKEFESELSINAKIYLAAIKEKNDW